MFNVTRQIGGSFGIALLTARIANRSAFHQTRLAQDATQSTVLQTVSDAVQTQVLTSGLSPILAPVASQGHLGAELARTAPIPAFQDAFLASGVVLFLGLAPCQFITRRSQPDQSQAPQPSTTE